MQGAISLFPIPLFVSAHYAADDEELHVLRGQEWTANRKGNFTSCDTYVLDCAPLQRLRAFLTEQLGHYCSAILGISEAEQLRITQSWVNMNPPGSRHHAHDHPNSIVSGVYFVGGDTCPIEFLRPSRLFGSLSLRRSRRNVYNATSWKVTNAAGHVVLFPSTLRHQVSANEGSDPRYSLSFNSFARLPIGSERKLTELLP